MARVRQSLWSADSLEGWPLGFEELKGGLGNLLRREPDHIAQDVLRPMIDKLVWNANSVNARVRTFHRFHDGRTETAGEHVLFHGDEVLGLLAQLLQKRGVDGFNEPHVHDAAGNAFFFNNSRRF